MNTCSRGADDVCCTDEETQRETCRDKDGEKEKEDARHRSEKVVFKASIVTILPVHSLQSRAEDLAAISILLSSTPVSSVSTVTVEPPLSEPINENQTKLVLYEFHLPSFVRENLNLVVAPVMQDDRSYTYICVTCIPIRFSMLIALSDHLDLLV